MKSMYGVKTLCRCGSLKGVTTGIMIISFVSKCSIGIPNNGKISVSKPLNTYSIMMANWTLFSIRRYECFDYEGFPIGDILPNCLYYANHMFYILLVEHCFPFKAIIKLY